MKLTTSRLKKLIREAMEDETTGMSMAGGDKTAEEGMIVYAVFDADDRLAALFRNEEDAKDFLVQGLRDNGYVNPETLHDSYDPKRQY